MATKESTTIEVGEPTTIEVGCGECSRGCTDPVGNPACKAVRFSIDNDPKNWYWYKRYSLEIDEKGNKYSVSNVNRSRTAYICEICGQEFNRGEPVQTRTRTKYNGGRPIRVAYRLCSECAAEHTLIVIREEIKDEDIQEYRNKRRKKGPNKNIQI